MTSQPHPNTVTADDTAHPPGHGSRHDTLGDLLARFAARGEATAVVQRREAERRTLSYGELARRAGELGAGMVARGAGPDAPVAIFAHNGVDWVVARFALVAAAAPCVPIDYDSDAGRVASLLEDSGARFLLVDPDLLEAAEAALAKLDRPIEVFLLNGEGDDEGDGGAYSGLDALTGEPAGEAPKADPDAPASRFYTSGTTGPPKAVPLTHRNLLINLDILLDLDLAGPADRVLLPLPLHHSFPFLVGLLLPLAAGATVVFPAGLSGPQIVEALREEKVSVLVGVPRMYDALIAAVATRLRAQGPLAGGLMRALRAISMATRRHLGIRVGRWLLAPLHKRLGPDLRLLASGGARLAPETEWALEGLGYRVLTGYGLVETTSVATFNMPDQARVGSAGLPSRAIEMRIRPVEGLDHGEVQFRGPIVFDGYADNPEANAEAFTEDGWFRTGDLGRVDGEGFLFIEGRRKEMIVLPDGKNVAPEEVEAVYRESPYVEEVAVLEHDDRLVALVVPDLEALRGEGTSDARTRLRVSFDEAGQRVPRYMRIADFAVTREALPRNQLGKYKRHELEAIYARVERGEAGPRGEISEADETLLSGERARALIGWLERRFPGKAIDPDTSLQMELGIDSLSWVDISLELERELGVALSEAAVAEVVTVRDLIHVVEAAPAAGGETAPRREAELRAEGDWLEEPGAAARAAGAVLYWANRLFARSYFRVHTADVGRVPDAGPVIVAANHVSDIDPFVLIAALPYRTARAVWWGGDRRRVFGTRSGRTVARIAHIFPVDDRAPKASLEMARRALERGRVLVWFPEEWRSPTGALQDFRPGIGVLLAETGATVVPCHIAGAFEAMPRTARFPRPRRVTVRFGEPVPAEALLPGGDGDESGVQGPARAAAAAVRERVAALAGNAGDKGETP